MNINSDQKFFTTSENLFDAVLMVVKSKDEKIRFLEFHFVIEHADLHIKNISIINIGKISRLQTKIIINKILVIFIENYDSLKIKKSRYAYSDFTSYLKIFYV